MTILRLGNRGDNVGELQRLLIAAGHTLEVTNVYDEATQTVVKAFQKNEGLAVDGIVGPKTFAALTRKGDAKRLTDDDLARAAAKLDVSLACVRAVSEVESRGSGFLSDGRPTILFERHVFWKRLKARGIDPAPHAERSPDIVSQTFGGYQGGAAEYTRLASAELIDATAARESASWGSFQVMGYHWERLGYPSIDDFVARMCRSEGEHLDAFVRFVNADPALLAALKRRDWAAFAKGYNGPNYARNRHDTKLEQEYRKFAAPDSLAA
jgi:hypothetical protein